MKKILLELTTQSRKRKIKDHNDFLEFYKTYKKRKTDEDNQDIEYGPILNYNFFFSPGFFKKEKTPRSQSGTK